MSVYLPLRYTVYLEPGCKQMISMPHAVICGVVFKGVEPKHLDTVDMRINGLQIVCILSSMDEDGEILTAGETLVQINAMRGIAQTGGKASLWLDEGSSKGLDLKGDMYGQLVFSATKEHKPGNVDVFFMCPFTPSGRF